MRDIFVEPQLRLRFPHRSEEFDVGVEVGVVVALMAGGQGAFRRSVSRAAAEQLGELAPRFDYRVRVAGTDGALVEVVFEPTRVRPKLTLVG